MHPSLTLRTQWSLLWRVGAGVLHGTSWSILGSLMGAQREEWALPDASGQGLPLDRWPPCRWHLLKDSHRCGRSPRLGRRRLLPSCAFGQRNALVPWGVLSPWLGAGCEDARDMVLNLGEHRRRVCGSPGSGPDTAGAGQVEGGLPREVLGGGDTWAEEAAPAKAGQFPAEVRKQTPPHFPAASPAVK